MKIAVYAIAKNEAPFVARMIESVADADWIVIGDTGSTDETVPIAAARGAIVHHLAIERFRFDIARNQLLELVPDDADLCLSLDLDEMVQSGWRKAIEAVWTPAATRGRYRYIWNWTEDGQPDVTFYADKLHVRHGYRWQRPCHEVVTATGIEEQVVVVEGLVVEHHADSAKSRRWYLPLLELSVAERPDDPGARFYLGREYAFNHKWDDAIREFQFYLALPGATWTLERSAAHRYLAVAHEARGDGSAALTSLEAAAAEAPEQREPWIDLLSFHFRHQAWSEGYGAANRGLSITERGTHHLTASHAWSSLAYDMAAYCAYRSARLAEAEQWAEIAVGMDPDDRRLTDNLETIRAQRALGRTGGLLPRS